MSGTPSTDPHGMASVWKFLRRTCDLPEGEDALSEVLDEYRTVMTRLARSVEVAQLERAMEAPDGQGTNVAAIDLYFVWAFLARKPEPLICEYALVIALHAHRLMLHALASRIERPPSGLQGPEGRKRDGATCEHDFDDGEGYEVA